jgi:hypothetical protein
MDQLKMLKFRGSRVSKERFAAFGMQPVLLIYKDDVTIVLWRAIKPVPAKQLSQSETI